MKKCLIKWFGPLWFCRMFHTTYTDHANTSNWYCDKCNLSYEKKLSDNDTGPL